MAIPLLRFLALASFLLVISNKTMATPDTTMIRAAIDALIAEEYEVAISLADSALSKAIVTGDSTTILRSHIVLGESYLYLRNYNTSLQHLDIALIFSRKLKMKARESIVLYLFGEYYDRTGYLIRALEYFEDALNIDELLADTNGIANLKHRIGGVFIDLGQYDRSLEVIFESLRISEIIQDSTLISYNLHNIGVLHEYMGNFDRAYYFYDMSTRLDSTLGDMHGYALGLMNLANIYTERKNYVNAERLLQQAFGIAITFDDPALVGTIENNMGNLFQELGDFEKARELYQSALQKALSVNDQIGQSHYLSNLADIHIRQNNVRRAINLLNESISVSRLTNSPEQLKHSYFLLYQAYDKLDEPIQAFRFFKLYSDLKDSLFNSDISRNFTQIELDRVFKRQQALERLDRETKEASLLAKIQYEQNIRNLILLFLVFSIGMIVIIGRNFAKINRINTDLQKTSRARNALYSIIAHDLKNPLTGLIGLSSILAEDHKDLSRDEIAFFSDRINRSSLNLHKLMDSLFDWANIEMKTNIFQAENVNIRESVDNVINLMHDVASTKEIRFKNNVDSNATVYWDRFLFDSILRNFTSNAIKYSYRQGSIEIHSVSHSSHTTIYVRDYGKGIDPEVKKIIEEGYETVSTPGTEHELGSGLGLLLSRQFANKYDATIGFIENEPGTCIYLQIKHSSASNKKG